MVDGPGNGLDFFPGPHGTAPGTILRNPLFFCKTLRYLFLCPSPLLVLCRVCSQSRTLVAGRNAKGAQGGCGWYQEDICKGVRGWVLFGVLKSTGGRDYERSDSFIRNTRTHTQESLHFYLLRTGRLASTGGAYSSSLVAQCAMIALLTVTAAVDLSVNPGPALWGAFRVFAVLCKLASEVLSFVAVKR